MKGLQYVSLLFLLDVDFSTFLSYNSKVDFSTSIQEEIYMIDRFERFSFAIMCISRYWHKIVTEEMEQYGLKGPYAIYLVALYRYNEGITAAKLGELCGKDKSDVSRTMTVMENAGLVYKEGNRYRALLNLTEKGIDAAKHVNERAKIAVDLAGGVISDEDREIMYNSLEKIAANLQTLSEDGIPKDK